MITASSALGLNFETHKRLVILDTIRIYSGPVPLAPDDVATGELLCELKGRLQYNPFSNSYEGVDLPWKAPVIRPGQAKYYRHACSQIPTALVQGSVGDVPGMDLSLYSGQLQEGDNVQIDWFAVRLS